MNHRNGKDPLLYHFPNIRIELDRVEELGMELERVACCDMYYGSMDLAHLLWREY